MSRLSSAAVAASTGASSLLKKAKTDEQLAQEVLAGGLNPQLYGTERGPLGDVGEADESDDLTMQIRMLLTSALNSGQIRSLARAVVLAWQAGYDSTLLRQAEPKLVKKAKEVKLTQDIRSAMAARNRVQLTDCLDQANQLGFTELTLPVLAEAQALDRELEAEISKMQESARPGHTKLMGSVIMQLSKNMFGLDIDQLQAEVLKESQSAKEHTDASVAKLNDALRRLKAVVATPISSEKLSELQSLKEVFKEVNPRNLEAALKASTEQAENLRADNAEMLMALRAGGVKVLTLSADSGGQEDPVAAAAEQERLLMRVQELEENEEVLRERVDQAAKLGAKWMEEKKDRELAEHDAEHAQALALALKDAAAKFEEELQRRTAEVAAAEKRAKVNALRGQEESLSKRHQEEVARLTAQIDQMMLSLEQGDRKIKQLEKVLKMRG